MQTSPRHSESGTSLVELMVALVVFGGIVIGILPLMHQSNVADLGSTSVTRGSQVAMDIMEILKLYRAIANAGGAVPDELAGFAISADPYEVTGEGIWTVLALDVERFEMDYTLSTDADTGRLLARVGVTSRDTIAGQGGGNRWVEFVSAIE